MSDHNLKFRAVTVPIANGSEPRVIEHDDPSAGIDNCVAMFPEIETPCDLSPTGQCEYSWRDNWHACVHCKQPSGLDE